MKRFAILLLSTVLFFALSACGASEKAQEKAAEKAIENATGGNVKVDIDGNKYTYEDKDGNKMEVGSTEWPTDEAAGFIPKVNKGKVTSTMLVGTVYMIAIENVKQSDYDSYLQIVKEAGFTDSALSLSKEDTGGYSQYQASDKEGNSILLSYEPEAETLQITGAIYEN